MPAHEAGDDASARDDVEHGDLLGDAQRVLAQRQPVAEDGDARSRGAAHQHGGHHVGARHRAVAVLVVLVDADAVPAQRLGVLELVEILVVERVADGRDRSDGWRASPTTTARRAPSRTASGGSSRTSSPRLPARAELGDRRRHRVRLLDVRHVAGVVEDAQRGARDLLAPRLRALKRRQPVVGAPGQQRRRRDASQPPAEQRIVEVRDSTPRGPPRCSGGTSPRSCRGSCRPAPAPARPPGCGRSCRPRPSGPCRTGTDRSSPRP